MSEEPLFPPVESNVVDLPKPEPKGKRAPGGRKEKVATPLPYAPPSGPDVDEQWDVDELKKEAQLELQRQLRHADPKIRRDAAREILGIVKQEKVADDEGVTEIAYLTND